MVGGVSQRPQDVYGALAPIYDDWQSCDGMIPFAELVRAKVDPLLRAEVRRARDAGLDHAVRLPRRRLRNGDAAVRAAPRSPGVVPGRRRRQPGDVEDRYPQAGSPRHRLGALDDRRAAAVSRHVRRGRLLLRRAQPPERHGGAGARDRRDGRGAASGRRAGLRRDERGGVRALVARQAAIRRRRLATEHRNAVRCSAAAWAGGRRHRDRRRARRPVHASRALLLTRGGPGGAGGGAACADRRTAAGRPSTAIWRARPGGSPAWTGSSACFRRILGQIDVIRGAGITSIASNWPVLHRRWDNSRNNFSTGG